jgi:hypothetical protein
MAFDEKDAKAMKDEELLRHPIGRAYDFSPKTIEIEREIARRFGDKFWHQHGRRQLGIGRK